MASSVDRNHKFSKHILNLPIFFSKMLEIFRLHAEPEIPKIYRRLLKIVEVFKRLPKISDDFRRLPKISKRLAKITKGVERFLTT